jgi:scyllo-inositol 2-dehydrogenase (NADP+)
MQPIKTALLSFGMSGKVFHAPFLQVHEGFEPDAVWERSKNEAQKIYPDIKTYRTLEDLLADEAIELVIVNTPNSTHFEYAKKALEAGKHVVVEKPFTVHSKDGDTLIALTKEKGLRLAAYHNRRWDSDFSTAKKVFDDGLLGEIVEAEFHFDRYKQELSAKQHKEIPQPGAGILYDLGAHLIDQALYLFGPPEAVFADVRILRPMSKVDDYFEVLLYYPQLRVRLHGSYLVREPVPSFVLHGTKGSFLKWRADVQEEALLAGHSPGTPDWGVEPVTERGLLHTEINGVVLKETIPTLQGNYMEYFNLLYEAMRNNGPVPVSAEEGMNNVRLIEAAFKSSAEKRVVEL